MEDRSFSIISSGLNGGGLVDGACGGAGGVVDVTGLGTAEAGAGEG